MKNCYEMISTRFWSTIIVLVLHTQLIAQVYQSQLWYIGDKEINMTNYSNAVVTPIPASVGVIPAKNTSSGIYYRGSNNLPVTDLVVSDNIVYQVSNNTSHEMFELAPNGPCTTAGTLGQGSCTGITGLETIIIPKPGNECSKYYIIWSRYNKTGSTVVSHTADLGYTEYDLSNVSAPIDNFIYTNLYPSQDIASFPPSFAVGKRLVNGNRYLYTVVPFFDGSKIITRIYKYNITSSGIAQVDLTPYLPNDYIEFDGTIDSAETELSHDQTTLAFARRNSFLYPNIGSPNAVDLVIVKLDGSGGLLGSSLTNVLTYNLFDYSGADEGYTGIEFTPNNLYLYINGKNVGIRRFNVATGTLEPNLVINSLDYSNSQLELRYFDAAFDQSFRICGVKDANQGSGSYEIGYINTNANAMAQNIGLTNFTYPVNQTFQNVNGIYTLQDQVDGEDYATWSSPNNSVACCVRYFKGTFDSEAPFQVSTGTSTWQPNSNPFKW